MRRALILAGLLALVLNAGAPVQGLNYRPCKNASIQGTPGDDFLIGTAGRDVIRSMGGSDTILGLGGGDVMCGGKGRDTIIGGESTDFAYGGGGVDRCQTEHQRGCPG